MKVFTNFLGANAGKRSVPAFYRGHVTEKSTELGSLYKKDILEFHDTKGNILKRPVVWANAEELVDVIS